MNKNAPPLKAWVWTAAMLLGLCTALAAYGYFVLGDFWRLLS